MPGERIIDANQGGRQSEDRLREAGSFKYLFSICETALEPGDLLRPGCLEGDARLLLKEGDLEGARRLYERLVGEALRLSEPNRLVLSRALGGLGAVSLRGLDLGGARRYFQSALAIAERLREADSDAEVATSLQNFGSALVASGEYLRARPLFERAVSIWERRGDESRSQLVSSLDSSARVLWTLGDYTGAQRLFERALALAEDELGGDRLSIAANLGGYARLLYSIGDYARARLYYERARSLIEKAGGANSPLFAVILSDLGNLSMATGDLTHARSLYQRSLRIFEARFTASNHPYVAAAIAQVAALNARRSPGDARKSLEKALALNEKVFGPDHPGLAGILRNLSAVDSTEGRSASALALLERALAIQEKALTAEHPEVADTLNQLAALKAAAGDRVQAASMFGRALSIQEKALGESHPDLAFTLYHIAKNRACTGGLESALDAAVRAETISGQHLSITAQRVSETDALKYASVRVSARDVVLSLVTEALPSERVKSVWDTLIRSRALVLDAVASRRRVVDASTTPEMRVAAEKLAVASRQLSNVVVRGPRNVPSMQAYRHLVEEAREARDVAERALAEKVVPFRQDLARRRFGLAEVALALPRDSALVAYVRYNRYEWADAGCATTPRIVPSYLALVLRSAGSDIVVRPLGPAPTIDTQVAAWRRAVGNQLSDAPEVSEASYRQFAAGLRRRVWDPVAGSVGDAQRVFIVPDGPLHLLNWGALPADDGRYLAEAGPLFHYLSAERDLVREQRARPANRGILVVGDPAFDDLGAVPSRTARVSTSDSPPVRVASANSGDWEPVRGPGTCVRPELRFEPLPGAGREAQGIAKLWQASGVSEDDTGRATLLLGPEATEGAFKSSASEQRVLHLATHGFFLGESCASRDSAGATRGVGGLAIDKAATPADPDATNQVLLSGLAMAGANRRAAASPDEEDGILTAEEIATLDLSGVDWAVLSACDTGVGEIRAGEGVFGLRRAFEVAGAGSLIMSLWPVGDEITERWMLALYGGRIDKHMETADAVRSASLQLLDDRRSNGQTTHPFYWAAFVAAGDWR